jgi:hypothetical protein
MFAENLEKFRITEKNGEFDELVIKNIEDFIPYRNEFIQLLITISKYSREEQTVNLLHIFFEQLIPYKYRPESAQSYSEWDYDNFKFIIHELFLYTMAIFLKYERFSYALHLMSQDYYARVPAEYGHNTMVSYEVFRSSLRSLEHRNKRLNLQRLSLQADLLKQRSHSTAIEFRYLMQADFVLFMRKSVEDSYIWRPDTLLYVEHFSRAFEIFARSASKTYFDKVKNLIRIESPRDLEPVFESYRQNKRKLPRWEFDSFDPSTLLGYSKLATKP